MKIYGLALILLVAACQQDFNAQWGKTPNLSSQKLTGGNANLIPPMSPVTSYLYVSNQDGWLYALDAGSGTQKWSAKIDGQGFPSPTEAFGQVYVSSDNYTYSFDAATGSIIWKAETYDTASSPMVIDKIVLTGGNSYYNGQTAGLYALDAAGGSVIWKSLNGMTVSSSPTTADLGGQKLVFAGASCNNNPNCNSDFYAVDLLTGKIVWQAALGGALYSSPAVVNGVVYVGAQNNLLALDAITGAIIWSGNTGGSILSSPTVAQGVVYIGCSNGKLYAFDANTGSIIWSSTVSTLGLNFSSPVVYNGKVYIGCLDHRLYAFDATTGAMQWAALTNGAIIASPTVANGVVYVGSSSPGIKGSNLFAFDYSTGSLIWSTAVGGSKIRSSACVVTSQVVFHPGISGEQQ